MKDNDKLAVSPAPATRDPMSLRMDPPIGRQAHMRETRAYPLMAVRAGPFGGTGELPRQDVKPVIPPYEGRKTQADRIGDASESAESGVKIGGASGPVADPDHKSPAPESTRRGCH